MTTDTLSPFALRVADLNPTGRTAFDIALKPNEIEILRALLDLTALRKVRLKGHVSALGKRDWQLTADLGATVVQPCVATLADVQTRIDVPVTRQFVTDFEEPTSEEVEMPDDDTVEPLGSHIDPMRVLEEALALALPLYPRADGAEVVTLRVTEPGHTAMTDDDAKPFAGLAALRDHLNDPEGNT